MLLCYYYEAITVCWERTRVGSVLLILTAPINRLPAPKYPAFNLFEEVLYDAIPVAIVSFVVNMSLAKTFASKHNYAIDSNQVNFTCNV